MAIFVTVTIEVLVTLEIVIKLQAEITYKHDIYTSVGVKPTNAAWAPSAATSDVHDHYIAEVSKKRCTSSVYNGARRCSTLGVGVL